MQTSEAYKATKEDILKRFINADNNYAKYKVFMELIDWLETTYERMEYKDESIDRLQRFQNKVFQIYPNIDLELDKLDDEFEDLC